MDRQGYGMGDRAVDAHLTHLARLGFRPGTVYQRERTLARLVGHTKRPALTATLDELRAFTGRPDIGRAAQRSEVFHLRGFYRWAVLEELRADDPTLRLEIPRVPRRYPRPMPERYVSRCLTETPERLRPWFWVAYYTGLRASEIAGLRADDIGDRWILVREQKGGDEGAVPIPPALRPILAGLPSSGWLFPKLGPGAAGPITGTQLSVLANRWLRAEEIPHSFHSIRHAFITNVYRVNHDLRMAQRLARHRSIQSTLLYAAVDDDEALATVGALPDFGPGIRAVA